MNTDPDGLDLGAGVDLDGLLDSGPLAPTDVTSVQDHVSAELEDALGFVHSVKTAYLASNFLLTPVYLERILSLAADYCNLEPVLPHEIFTSTIKQLLECKELLLRLESTPILQQQLHPPAVEGPKGRLRWDVPEATLRFYCEMGYTAEEIGYFMKVSERTVRRRKEELSIVERSTNITDAELVGVVIALNRNGCRRMGEEPVMTTMRELGIVVSRERVRRALRYTDPKGVIDRWQTVISRRVYSVPFVNSLWHIDGALSSLALALAHVLTSLRRAS